jgi:hypothetical protein
MLQIWLDNILNNSANLLILLLPNVRTKVGMKEWDMEDMESMEEWATETGPVIQEPVNTGNPHLDKAINKFYNCLSHIHEDPPTVHFTVAIPNEC